MSDISMEQKLELVNQIRSQYHRNQSDLMNREQILYGRSSARDVEYRTTHSDYRNYSDYREHRDFMEYSGAKAGTDEEGILSDNTFKIRLALAGVLFLIVVMFDKTGKSLAGISTNQVFQAIATDYGANMEEWVETSLLK